MYLYSPPCYTYLVLSLLPEIFLGINIGNIEKLVWLKKKDGEFIYVFWGYGVSKTLLKKWPGKNNNI